MSDFLFRGSIDELDAEVYQLTALEEERQIRKLILIPSESYSPLAVRQALASGFHNIYAEGYPNEETRTQSQAEILDYDQQLAYFRRYSDLRYYKGVEYADIVEALARRRCAELFAANGITPDDLFVNVQPLSGAPANNAVYHALLSPGDTILGMDLLHGGHLTHGSPANRSGKLYHAVHYSIDPETEKINYQVLEKIAIETKPKIIVAGYSSYPWQVDWFKFKEIARSVNAWLLADIAHVAGLVAGGVYPSPIGIADIVTFTTHKTLCGPRGACIITAERALARKIDRAVFPGEQGGPHVNVFAAMAIAFKLAGTEQFRHLQSQIVKNCTRLVEQLTQNGIKVAYRGSDTHLLNIDCREIVGGDGATLSGDQAARILDLAGIVVNRNTLPGDRSAGDPSGIRLGTPWITQRGFKESEITQLAAILADLLHAIKPYHLESRKGEARRAKVDFNTLEQAKMRVRNLAEQSGTDYLPAEHGYPHFYYTDRLPADETPALLLSGEKIRSFLNYTLSSDIEDLHYGEEQAVQLVLPAGVVGGKLSRIASLSYSLVIDKMNYGSVSAWLRDLSDGFVYFDQDLLKKLPGPVSIADGSAGEEQNLPPTDKSFPKPYAIGIQASAHNPLPAFSWQEQESSLRRTPLYDVHRSLGAKIIPFAGWEMPVWYSSVVDEHLAVRQSAGIFDVAHMGVYQVEGEDAVVFLDSVVGNDIAALAVGESCYTHLLDADAQVIDDLLVYRRAEQKYLVVVNASNDDKNWSWLNGVQNGSVKVSNSIPASRAFGRNAVLRNLRDPREGEDMRVDIALQGPKSRDILFALGVDELTRKKIMRLNRTDLCEAVVGGFDLVISRTGYTGEKMAFELFVHPEKAAKLFQSLLEVGGPLGLKPVGLGARDSLRTEAGLPLYGHEMGAGSRKMGHADLGVAEAGFGSYVKTYKPWFIGRDAYLASTASQFGVVVRFRFLEKGVRMAHPGDPVVDRRARVIGWVTSCAIDNEGMLTGQAYIELKSAEEGNSILIYQGAPDKVGKAPKDFQLQDKSILPTPAVILSRFPK